MANRSAAAFDALGDPVRRHLLERLAGRPGAVGELAAELPISRPAVSQHLGLVCETSEGTRRIYRLDPRGLAAMRGWLDAHWATALDGFAAFTATTEEPRE